jgi:hypothetical protein
MGKLLFFKNPALPTSAGAEDGGSEVSQVKEAVEAATDYFSLAQSGTSNYS